MRIVIQEIEWWNIISILVCSKINRSKPNNGTCEAFLNNYKHEVTWFISSTKKKKMILKWTSKYIKTKVRTEYFNKINVQINWLFL